MDPTGRASGGGRPGAGLREKGGGGGAGGLCRAATSAPGRAASGCAAGGPGACPRGGQVRERSSPPAPRPSAGPRGRAVLGGDGGMLSPDGGCPRTAAVPGRRLSPAGGCHQTGSASPWQSAPRLHRSAPTSRGEERGEECCSSGGGTSGPGQAQPPPRGTATPTPAGPRQQRRSAAPPAPQPPPPRPDPFPAPLRGRPRHKSPPEGADKGAPDRSLTEFSSPEPLPFIFSAQNYARPLWRLGAAWAGEPPAAAGHGVPGGQRCASGVPTCQSATDVPPMCQSVTGASPTCHRGGEPRPGSLCAPPDLNAEIPLSSKNYTNTARDFRFASKRPRWFGTEEPGRGSLFACFRGAQPARRREKKRGPFPKGGGSWLVCLFGKVKRKLRFIGFIFYNYFKFLKLQKKGKASGKSFPNIGAGRGGGCGCRWDAASSRASRKRFEYPPPLFFFPFIFFLLTEGGRKLGAKRLKCVRKKHPR